MIHKLNISVILLIPLFICSCEKLARNSIVGVWAATDYVLTNSVDGAIMPKTPKIDEEFNKWHKGSTIEFFSDGTAAMNHNPDHNLQYSIQGNNISITAPKLTNLDYPFEITIRKENEKLVTVNNNICDYFDDGGVAYPGHMVYLDWILTRTVE